MKDLAINRLLDDETEKKPNLDQVRENLLVAY